MARKFTVIKRSIWQDPDFTALTAGAQWLYFLRRTQNQSTRFTPEEAATYAAGADAEEVKASALELADTKFGYILNRKSQRQTVTPSLRLAVFQADNWACAWCGSTEVIELDHIIPVSKGGGNERENLQTLCYDHNRKKGARLYGTETDD